jgi:hypothetical protein
MFDIARILRKPNSYILREESESYWGALLKIIGYKTDVYLQ